MDRFAQELDDDRSARTCHKDVMIELIRTNDIVLLGAVEAFLRGAGIHVFVADGYMSALEGSVGALQRRLLVAADAAEEARNLLREAGFGGELRVD
ncbi:putative signal transducing protein [Chelatococcus asaccharovorans]|uniref:Putative signal transducing protein n=2 Tax=Chelatococcus asaccharovorans TaxID=28210 RepID=A0A2V3U3D2_9HYPH|nr:putative signal transducing protein [Chelatococcus asaccharovorans]CAH1669657.1 putative signal transducing protein [Chelatococcus asaccharovorans]CAH1678885.1 putative signal transducing protein [Chelatococcus asaccharovorans]